MTDILIKNALKTVTMNSERETFSGGHILIKNGVIESIGPEALDIEVDQVIDAHGMIVIPGLVNTHHHLYQSLTRNIPLMQDQELFPWLQNHYEVWRELDEEAIDVSTRIGLIELMMSGASTVADHLYLFPEKTEKNLIDVEIEAARSLGVRFHPTRGSMSLGRSQGGLPPDDVVQDEKAIQADIHRLLRDYHEESAGAMVSISLAPCSPFSVTESLMRWTADFALENDIHIHTHLAETLDEEEFCLANFGKRPLGYAKHLGWLNRNAWFAHSVFVSEAEIVQMGKAEVGVSHCPSSNMRLGSGIAPIREMLDSGVKVSLGVDGSASNDSGNLLAEMRNALLISRLRPKEYWLSAEDVLEMATLGGARVLGRSDIGSLEPGNRGDVAIFDLRQIAHAGSLSDPVASLVFTSRLTAVDYLIIEGEPKIQGGKYAGALQPIVDRHNELSHELIQRASIHSGIDFFRKGGRD